VHCLGVLAHQSSPCRRDCALSPATLLGENVYSLAQNYVMAFTQICVMLVAPTLVGGCGPRQFHQHPELCSVHAFFLLQCLFFFCKHYLPLLFVFLFLSPFTVAHFLFPTMLFIFLFCNACVMFLFMLCYCPYCLIIKTWYWKATVMFLCLILKRQLQTELVCVCTHWHCRAVSLCGFNPLRLL